MNYQVTEKKQIDIENMIYEIRGKQVMLDSKISAIKDHDYSYDNIVNIDKLIAMLINFVDTAVKLERNQKLW